MSPLYQGASMRFIASVPRYEMESMTLLRFEHKRIDSLAGELAAMVNRPAPPEPLRFLRLRREFSRTLAVHLGREDWVVYPRLFADPRPEVRALATPLAAEAAAFSAAFRDYSRQWTTVCIAADRAGFRKETLALLAGLRRRIHVEEGELYPLVDDAGRDLPLRQAG